MDYQYLLTEQIGHILKLTINRPDKLNALNIQIVDELDHFFSQRHEARVIIISGAGDKAFVAGADISQLATLSPEEASVISVKGQQTMDKIENSNIPVIAAVNGYALGGGCELALACHIRIGSMTAVFGQPEINLGLIPGYGGTQRFPRAIGPSNAIEYMLTGDYIGAQRAYDLGLISHLLEEEELEDYAMVLAKKIAAKPPIQAGLILEAVRGFYDKEVKGFENESKMFGECTKTADFKEGTLAFAEKRRPDFKGE
jgi:enoyl-CoA hydratase